MELSPEHWLLFVNTDRIIVFCRVFSFIMLYTDVVFIAVCDEYDIVILHFY